MQKSMKLVLTASIALFGSVNLAHADGFVCSGVSTGLNVKIYNHTQASLGTRSPAIMVISDPTAEANEQTLTTFSSDSQTLTYQGYGAYVGTLATAGGEESVNGDRMIAGVKMSELKTIQVTINFSYASGTTALAKITVSIPGKIQYHNKNGEFVEEKLDCTRYLKN